jgi:hypothetical protein
VFSDEVTELAAFKAGQLDWYDWTLPAAEVNCSANPNCLQNNPDALVTQPVGAADMTQFDFNHHMPWFGLPGQVSSGLSGVDQFGLTVSTKQPNPSTTLILKGVSHLFDKASWILNGPCQGPQCVAIDDPIPNPVCTDTVAPCSTFSQRVAWDSLAGTGGRLASLCVSAAPGQPCAYKLANGPATLAGIPSAADIAIAKDYFFAAGLKDVNGGTDNTKLIAWSGAQADRIIFLIRTDDDKRFSAGSILANTLDGIFSKPGGTPVVNRILGDIRALGRYRLTVPLDDWNIYTGKWGLGLDATHLHALYDSSVATNDCGGAARLSTLNYGVYCRASFDAAQRAATFQSLSVGAFNTESQIADNIAGGDVMIMPLFSDAALTLGHNGWDGIIDVKGSGITNANAGVFNWFSMRAKAGYTGSTLGPPGGGNPNVLRAGFRQGTDKLNIFGGAGTQWEAYASLSPLYDSPGGFNPRALTNPLFDPYETMVTRVDQRFCASFSICGLTPPTGTPDATPITRLDFYFRSDILFHDGVQVTASDFVKSCLAYRDVPNVGYGFDATCAPLLDTHLPVPESVTAANPNGCAPLCATMVMNGQSFLHKLFLMGIPVVPVHLWDSNGDGFICGAIAQGSCAGRAADATTDVNFDPMAAGILVGSGPFMCLDLDTGKPGGSCSQTAAGLKGGQAIGTGGRFLFTRNDQYILGSPNVAGSPLHKFSQADSVCTPGQACYRSWNIDINHVSAVEAPGHSAALQLLVLASLDFHLAGVPGKALNNIDTTDAGNTLFQLNP